MYDCRGPCAVVWHTLLTFVLVDHPGEGQKRRDINEPGPGDIVAEPIESRSLTANASIAATGLVRCINDSGYLCNCWGDTDDTYGVDRSHMIDGK